MDEIVSKIDEIINWINKENRRQIEEKKLRQ